MNYRHFIARLCNVAGLAAALWLSAASTVLAAGGDFDTTFSPSSNPAGIARFIAGGSESRSEALLVTETNAVFVAGYCLNSVIELCISKRNAGGGADSSFGGSGTVTISGFGSSGANALTRDRQGNLWVGGMCRQRLHPQDLAVRRLLRQCRQRWPDHGSPIAIGASDDHDCRRQDSGRWRLHQCRRRPACLGRLLTTAALILRSTAGAMWVWSTLRGGAVKTLIPRSDGKVYLGATCDTGTSSAVNRMCYADIASNGSLLSTYTASVPGSTAATLGGLVLASDGALIGAGTCTEISTGNFRGCMFRFQPATGIDTAFGSSGYIMGVALGATTMSVYGLLEREDGSLIMVTQCMASTTPFQRYGICLAAFAANGTPSPQFGGQSTRLLDTEPTPIGGSSQASWLGTAATITGDGKLVTSGSCFAGVSSPQSCIARLQLETTPVRAARLISTAATATAPAATACC